VHQVGNQYIVNSVTVMPLRKIVLSDYTWRFQANEGQNVISLMKLEACSFGFIKVRGIVWDVHLETAECFWMYTWGQLNFFVHRLPS